MLIDWFTVGAQVLNFLVLVWLLHRFLYRPILRLVDERGQSIAAAMEKAQAKLAEAEQVRAALSQRTEQLELQRASLLAKAEAEAKSERERLCGQAQAEGEALRAKFQDGVRREREAMGREIARQTQEEVLAIARRALADLAGVGLEGPLAEVFIRRLTDLPRSEKEKLSSFPPGMARVVVIRTATDPAPELRAKIANAVAAALGPGIQACFETAHALIGGIELAANGYKLTWGIDSYLAGLEKSAAAIPGGDHAADERSA